MILLVKAPYKIRLTRVLNRKGMTKEKFDAIVGLQLPDSVKSQYSDLVIENDNIDAVSKQVMSIINGEYTR
jgi:dephospho-CoA kinase